MPICPICRIESRSWDEISDHIYFMANEKSDPDHIMWLNRFVSKNKLSKEELSNRLRNYFDEPKSLPEWIRYRFIEKFYGKNPHLFMILMQNPTRGLLLGYVIEHRHFLQNWVKVLSKIIYNTDKEDVIRYELENIATEYIGYNGKPSHYELLIKMGESLGLSREKILSYEPLPSTKEAISTWRNIAETRPWVETMAAMHSLELAADKTNLKYGAKIHYFNPNILSSNQYNEHVKNFLREGYEADEGHAGEALRLIDNYSQDYLTKINIKVTLLKSWDALDKYLYARIQRAMEFEPELFEVIRSESYS
ncbi:pyrroloquinoline quinone (coenzyme PQQ) biosynthesis protein C [Caldisphaera lagunensis DSM 15908]|uniref:Pyrroloquinoline quinone (Coenzyme PQQ) biosynthesis protein C n=1 Tax=Caldisphaera lagunensis (strain DSM 15908 / JCM 11604 / ANMR 0165 / IC-154) TaxID=1056495 RepID=L0A9R0_CALLD|nr:C2H2 type zinc finger domain-containing protein [Caldisphaera lagunensis]AFZ69882.1 pyrroloquinoline quinone (coenzyme PQQ) biosynthesis protein C [Caldisphaera lagunensis DSM 15908]